MIGNHFFDGSWCILLGLRLGTSVEFYALSFLSAVNKLEWWRAKEGILGIGYPTLDECCTSVYRSPLSARTGLYGELFTGIELEAMRQSIRRQHVLKSMPQDCTTVTVLDTLQRQRNSPAQLFEPC